MLKSDFKNNYIMLWLEDPYCDYYNKFFFLEI